MIVCSLRLGGRSTEGRGLDDLLAEDNVHELKASTNNARTAKQRANLLGRRVGRDIEVFGFKANNQVAHGTTDNVGLKPFMLKDLADFDGVS